MKPLFNGQSEISQINKIFKELGTPSDKIWPGPPAYSELPATKKMTFADYPYNNLRNKFGATLTDKGFDLLNRLVLLFFFTAQLSVINLVLLFTDKGFGLLNTRLVLLGFFHSTTIAIPRRFIHNTAIVLKQYIQCSEKK